MTTRQILLTQADVVWSITVPRGMKIPVTAEMVGGGGGGGGNDSQAGGSGSAGQYCKHVFTVSKGDVLSFVVGGGSGAGASGSGGATGGTAGTSVIAFPSTVFSLRTNTGNPRTYNKTDPRWSSFMNNNAVWENNVYSSSFDRTYQVNFPATGVYQWQVQADNAGTYYLDGVSVASTTAFQGTEKTVDVTVTAGVHTVRVVGSNSGDVGGICLVIKNSPAGGNFIGSLSGGRGGNAGTSGSSGGGGGGGGASALILNGVIIAIAGGGGGGGGGGNHGGGASASNTYDTASVFYNGQAGQAKRGDGGGGGGSGGGYRAGNGGTESPGDLGGLAGQAAYCFNINNLFFQNDIQLGSGRTPYIPSGRTDVNLFGVGGTNTQSGTQGYVRLTFDTTFASYKLGNIWKDVVGMYIKESGVWQEIDGYTKIRGEWQALARREIALYKTGNGVVGIDYRDLAMIPEPVVTYYNPSTEGSSSWGGGFEGYGGFGGGFAGTQGSQGFGFGNDSGFDGHGDTSFA